MMQMWQAEVEVTCFLRSLCTRPASAADDDHWYLCRCMRHAGGPRTMQCPCHQMALQSRHWPLCDLHLRRLSWQRKQVRHQTRVWRSLSRSRSVNNKRKLAAVDNATTRRARIQVDPFLHVHAEKNFSELNQVFKEIAGYQMWRNVFYHSITHFRWNCLDYIIKPILYHLMRCRHWKVRARLTFKRQ